jgi:hypothetical protein
LVSRIQCLISVDKGSAAIEDCGGAIGTLVNGEKVGRQHTLKNSDHIKIGGLELEVRLTAGEEREKKPQLHNVRNAATCTVAPAATANNESDVLGWLEKEDDRHGERVTLVKSVAVQDVVAGAMHTDTPAAPTTQGRRVGRFDAHKAEIEWDGIDRLLLAAVGVVLVAILSMLLPPMMEWCVWLLDVRNWSLWAWLGVGLALAEILLLICFWPATAGEIGGKEIALLLLPLAMGILPLIFGLLDVHDAHWYWIWLVWCSSRRWVQWGALAIFAAMLASLVLIRARLQR